MMTSISKSFLMLILAVALTFVVEVQAATGGTVIRNIEYATVDGKSLLLDVYQPTVVTEPLPCVVWIHGGGWYSGSKANPAILPIVNQGYALVSINYRLTRDAPFPAQIYDCKAAIRWVRANAAAYNIDPDRIAVAGFSAGGHLAALIGTSGDVPELEGTEGILGVSSKVQAVVDGYGPTDFRTMWPAIVNNPDTADPGELTNVEAVQQLLRAGSSQEVRALAEEASPVEYISAETPPFYIFHGTEDQTVPPEQSQELYDDLISQGCVATLDWAQGQGHGVQGPEVARRIVVFLNSIIGNQISFNF